MQLYHYNYNLTNSSTSDFYNKDLVRILSKDPDTVISGQSIVLNNGEGKFDSIVIFGSIGTTNHKFEIVSSAIDYEKI